MCYHCKGNTLQAFLPLKRKKDCSLHITNCTCISPIQQHVLLLCNSTKCWFSLGSSSTAALHPLSKEKHMICSLCCVFVCVWWTLHNISSFTWPTEYHPIFSRPFLWFVGIVYPPQEHASSAPATSLLSLECVLFSLATCLGTSWIALVLGQIPVKIHSLCLILTVSHWKLPSKCSFLLVNLLCYAAYLYRSFWLIFETTVIAVLLQKHNLCVFSKNCQQYLVFKVNWYYLKYLNK